MTLALSALVLAVVTNAARTTSAPSPLPAPDTLRVVLVVDDTVARRSLVQGARLGAEEASHTGAMFGTVVTLRVESRGAFDSTARASGADASRAALPSLYVVAGDSSTCSAVMPQSVRPTIPVLDAGCPFIGGPSAKVAYSLLPASAFTATAGDSVRVELWHWSLERFGGEQLNERYRRRFGERMDSPAWAGWLALKIALDAALHAQKTDGGSLLRQLADPRAQYDGQKGRPLRFAADTHRLVQPVYRVTGRGDDERVVAEVAP
ncbi:MAG TPA: hypothetical protein VFN39_02905 [Gemmatimonadaceae bacterium]|nr:hypothetical protein [Gemmatimonadaceae bacterium]